MAWSTSRPPRNPKYRTREHLAMVRAYKAELARVGWLTCTARECVMPTRTITNPDGSQPDGVTVGHADDGVAIDGPQHRRCNIRDGSKRARARQIEQPSTSLRW